MDRTGVFSPLKGGRNSYFSESTSHRNNETGGHIVETEAYCVNLKQGMDVFFCHLHLQVLLHLLHHFEVQKRVELHFGIRLHDTHCLSTLFYPTIFHSQV